MDPAEYDRWYETPRGRWIGEREAARIVAKLRPRPGESLLDVGCGTGFFTRTLSRVTQGVTVGVDIDAASIDFARRRDPGGASYAVADARALPYPDASFDLVVSVAALCFIAEASVAVREIVRVTRRRFAIGLLHRKSLLYLQKGHHGGRGSYRGARWHTTEQAKTLLSDLHVCNLSVCSAIQIPTGGLLARGIEHLVPPSLLTGAFLLVTGDVGSRGKARNKYP